MTKEYNNQKDESSRDLIPLLSVEVPAVTCYPLYCFILFSNSGNIRKACANWAIFNIFARLQGKFSRILLKLGWTFHSDLFYQGDKILWPVFVLLANNIFTNIGKTYVTFS